MSDQGRVVSRFIGAMAILLALVVTIVPPAVWFAFNYESLRTHLKEDAEIGARMVTGLVVRNPLLWQYDDVRLRHALEIRETLLAGVRRRVFDARGMVAEIPNRGPAAPIVSESALLWDAGKPAGRVEASCSLRPLLLETAVAGLFSVSASVGMLFLFMVFPVSAIRRALDSLAEEREIFRETFQSITDGIISTGMDGKVLLMNPPAESVTGWSRKEAAGKYAREILPLLNADGAPVLPANVPLGSHGVIISRTGDRCLVDIVEAPISPRKTASVRSVIVFRDITEKKRMEEEIVRGQRLESLGLLAGGIAHDFNNLLTGVLGNISLAKDMVAPTRREFRRLEEAEKATMKAKELSGRLLSFSKGGKPDRREIPVEEVVRDAAQLAVRGTNVRCGISSAEGLWGAYADAGQIGQVINNLAVNAVQAMPEGGTILVDMENVTVGESEVRHVRAGNYVKITISDEGSGIPEDILPRLFEPYFTTKESGSGLGLATCYTIMKGHGGNIFAGSLPGRGAAFHLYIPSFGNVVRPPEPPEKQATHSGKGKVLLMDDEETVREVAGEMLAHLGYEPRFTRDGGEAVEMYVKEAKGAGRFDLVILDLTVPAGMGGKEAASRILENDPDARIIASSGRADDPAMSDPGQYGFAAAAVKPYKLEELGRALCLAASSSRPGLSGR